MLQFRPGTQGGLQVFARPGLGLHEGRVGAALGGNERLEGIQPGPVQVLGPGIGSEGGHLALDLGRLGVKVDILVLAHAFQEAGGFIGTHGGEEIQPFGQAARLFHGAHIAPDDLAKDILIQGEALAHEAEALGDQLLILLDPDPHRVDLGRREGLGSLLELGKQGRVGELVQVGIGPEDLVRKGAVFDIAQVIRLADDEDGRLVDVLPQADGGSAIGGGGRAQRLDQQQGPAGLEIVRLAEGQPPVPHHGLEIHLQVFAAGVMAARDVLGVIFDQLHILAAGRAGPRWARWRRCWRR